MMARTVEEIKADYATRKGQGVHVMSKEMRALRAEIKALEAPEDETTGVQTPQAEVQVNLDPAPAAAVPEHPPVPRSAFADGAVRSVYDSDEWRFIEKAIAEIEIEARSGSQTGQFKAIYHQLDAKVKMWRRIRRLALEVGEGGEWPQFGTLGMDPRTGLPIEAKPEPAPAPVEPPAPENAPGPPATEGGMPVHTRPFKDQIKDFVMGGGGPADAILSDLETRPEPTRQHPETVESS